MILIMWMIRTLDEKEKERKQTQTKNQMMLKVLPSNTVVESMNCTRQDSFRVSKLNNLGLARIILRVYGNCGFATKTISFALCPADTSPPGALLPLSVDTKLFRNEFWNSDSFLTRPSKSSFSPYLGIFGTLATCTC